MASRFKPLAIAFWCALVGACMLGMASTQSDSYHEAVKKLHTWPTTRATVVRDEDFGNRRCATVKFIRPDRIHGEAHLFSDDEQYGNGQPVQISYNPEVDYTPGPALYPVETPTTLLADADPKFGKYALAWLGGAIPLLLISVVALYRGRAVLLGLFKNPFPAKFPAKSKAARLLRPIQRLTPADKAQAQLQQFPTHLGDTRSGEVYFLASPPPEIGATISAESSVPRGSGPAPLATRMAIGLILAGLVLVGMMLLPLISEPSSGDNTVRILGVFLAPAVLLAHFLAVQYKANCSYIGAQGLARCSVTGRLEATPKVELFLFDDAADLYAEQTEIYLNGAYRGTEYNFTWMNEGGSAIYRIHEIYQKAQPSVEGDTWRFTQAAETLWTARRYEAAKRELASDGAILFRIRGDRSLWVGQGFVKFQFGQDAIRLNRDQIGSFKLESGTFSLKSTDARWLSLAGKFSFSYSEVANAKMFLMAMEELLGKPL